LFDVEVDLAAHLNSFVMIFIAEKIHDAILALFAVKDTPANIHISKTISLRTLSLR